MSSDGTFERPCGHFFFLAVFFAAGFSSVFLAGFFAAALGFDSTAPSAAWSPKMLPQFFQNFGVVPVRTIGPLMAPLSSFVAV